MLLLNIILSLLFVLSILLNLLSLNSKKKSIEIVNEIGIGYNLANLFDSYDISKEIKSPEDQITLYGNEIPTKQMIKSIKKSGFRTIRFPVTWANLIDEYGNININWLNRVKEVIDLIIEYNIYCILNIQRDSEFGNWLWDVKKAKNRYIRLWQQIAEVFKIYDEHLIFESFNEITYQYGENYDYESLYNLNQAFVDTIRNSGGYNFKRLLLVSGAVNSLEYSLNSYFKIPIDPGENIGLSIHYYFPSQFTMEPDDEPWYYNSSGYIYEIPPFQNWGNQKDYNEMLQNFELLKKSYLDKGIVIVLSEIGVITEHKKEKESIREYLYALFSFARDYKGIVPCLWDTSNKNTGDMNYFDREINQWYDELIKVNFIKISKKKFVKPTEYYVNINIERATTSESEDYIHISIGIRTPKSIIFNVKITNKTLSEISFHLVTENKNNEWYVFEIKGLRGQKQYDGSYTFNYDTQNMDFNTYIRIQKYIGSESITLNYLAIEFEESFTSFDIINYKNAVLNNIY